MLTLIVAGRVRKGELTCVPEGQTEPCSGDGCRRWAEFVLTSKRGRTTFVCAQCCESSAGPQPIRWGGVDWVTVAQVRAAVAGGISVPLPVWGQVEKYERDKKRWDKAVKPHGFKRVEADPRKRTHISLWTPEFSSTQVGMGMGKGKGQV